MDKTRRQSITSTPVAVALTCLANGVFGLLAGYFIVGHDDPKRLRFAFAFGLLLALMGASSTYRRRETEANDLHHEAISAGVALFIVAVLIRFFG
jgi:uncharacterized membrane protein YfcA